MEATVNNEVNENDEVDEGVDVVDERVDEDIELSGGIGY